MLAIVTQNLFTQQMSNSMFMAIWEADFPTVKTLIDNGTESVNNMYKRNPMVFEALENYISIIRNPADALRFKKISSGPRNLPTIKEDAKKIIVFLLDKNAPKNSKGYRLRDTTKQNPITALHLAVEADLPEIVDILLEYGADTSITNREGLTAYEVAVKARNQKIKEVFGAHRMRGGFIQVQTKTNTNDVCFTHQKI